MATGQAPGPLTEDGPAPAPGTGPRTMRVIIGSSILSKVADWQLGIVVPLAVLAQTDSVAMSLIAISLRGVTYVGSPFLGSLIDRLDKRTVFALSQFQQALCLVLLAALLTDRLSVALLLLLSGFGGVVSTITGQFVLIPSLIAAPERPTAVAKLNSAVEFAKVLGLVLGGVGFSTLGPVAACAGIAVLYCAAGSVALLLPRVPAVASGHRGMRRDLAVGFRWLGRREILWLVVTMTLTNLAVGQLERVLVTTFGHQGVNPGAISVVLAGGLLVGAVGSRLAPSVLPSLGPEARILACQLAAFAGLLLVTTPYLAAQLAGYTLECLAVAVSNVASITHRQETIPVEVAGRANATIRMFITGAVPLSGFLYAAASRFDGFLFWLPALGVWAVAIVIWAVHLRRVGPAGRAPEGADRGDH
ncbi:MFS transporter [Kitasatospora sp. NPDC051853]|uniref:MFS transporter n=1 Tax=Kitasatospora sp. NPDC051853 TaxID=3364058 RepID=UPI00379AEA3C